VVGLKKVGLPSLLEITGPHRVFPFSNVRLLLSSSSSSLFARAACAWVDCAYMMAS
jgi:hypothetical protein